MTQGVSEPLMMKALIRRIREIADEPIYIGASADELQRGIAENCRYVSASEEECDAVTGQELEEALTSVIESWRSEVARQAGPEGAIFYTWFDAQACQLRLCLISGLHSTLPFGCEVRFVSSMSPIIDEFLSFWCHDGIPWDGLSPVEWSEDTPEPVATMNVYAVRVP